MLDEYCSNPDNLAYYLGDAPAEACHAEQLDNYACWMSTETGVHSCADAKAAGMCDYDMPVNWWCGATCRDGAPWDECMFYGYGTAQEQIDRDCADATFQYSYGYPDTEACVDDSLANFVADDTGTCEGDSSGSGADCYFKGLGDYGSTEVHHAQCSTRRRKLERSVHSGTRSGAMKTKGAFTLTSSGSK